jgi:hypothetical protein
MVSPEIGLDGLFDRLRFHFGPAMVFGSRAEPSVPVIAGGWPFNMRRTPDTAEGIGTMGAGALRNKRETSEAEFAGRAPPRAGRRARRRDFGRCTRSARVLTMRFVPPAAGAGLAIAATAAALIGAAPSLGSPTTPSSRAGPSSGSASRLVVPFIADRFDQALEQARANHRPVFIEAWAPW